MLAKSEIIRTRTSEIWVDEDGILRVKVMEGAELTYEEVKKCFEVYSELGYGKNDKALQIMDARANCTMNKEGRDYAAKVSSDFFIACAVITNNLPVKLIVNFFNSFYKTGVPMRIFSSEEKALEWLLKYK